MKLLQCALLLLISTSLLASEKAPLFPQLDRHHHPISTESAEAQRYFDQGLLLAFGFNHAEAHRSFLQVTELDPECAMGWWGAAWVLGPNINNAMDPAKARRAWRLLQQARSLEDISSREKAYIDALAVRYGPKPLSHRWHRDREFAEAMGRVAARFPHDLDARVIYAEALMTITPWDYREPDGELRTSAQQALSALQQVLDRDPRHLQANHLLIHLLEAGQPELALPAAERLSQMASGPGHLIHMPSHIHIRLGHYHQATAANLRAIKADREYRGQVAEQNAYQLVYVPHNYHFGWATATLEGRSRLANRLAMDMAHYVDKEAMRERDYATLQHYWVTPVYSMVRFGEWDRILKLGEPDPELVYPRAVRHYARGMALLRRQRLEEAYGELQQLAELREDEDLEWVSVWDINKSRQLLDIAYLTLMGELAAAEGNYSTAVSILREALRRENELNYDEPPTWHHPVRQTLGAVLIEADRPATAAGVYREDLKRFPDNGWSLFGLLQALRAQGKTAEAEHVERRFRHAWRHADLILTASRF